MTRDRWLEVEVRHFAALDAVSHEGSFRAAADRLGYVQSAISQQIAFLERVAGVRLVERSRGPGPVKLTPAGQLVLVRARDILRQLEAARTDLCELEDTARRTVTLGMAATPMTGILAALVSAVAHACPHVLLDPHDVDCDQTLVRELESGRLDLALAELPPPGPGLACELLATEPYRVLAAARAPRPATAAEVAGHPIVAPAPTRSFQRVLDWFRERGSALNIAYSSSDAATIGAWAAAGLGLAIVPTTTPSREWPGFEALTLEEPLPVREVGLVWSEAHPPTGVTALVREVGTALR
jgi:DNA-binding transcriptional LysR family regulator